MQVLCMATTEAAFDVECPRCQQRYLIFYSRFEQAECAAALEGVRIALLDHHEHTSHASAHPPDAFNIPAWAGPAHASAAALLSGAPIRRTPAPAPNHSVASTAQRRVS